MEGAVLTITREDSIKFYRITYQYYFGIDLHARNLNIRLAIANAFVDLVYTDEALQIYRLIIAEQQQFLELGELIYRSGPESVLRHVSSFLAELHVRGNLIIGVIETTSRLFLDRLKDNQNFLACWGCNEDSATWKNGI